MTHCKHIESEDLPGAVRDQHESCVNTLIDKGADVNKTDKYRVNPLMYAICNGDVNSVNQLIKAGADVNYHVNQYYFDLVMWATREGQAECLEALIKGGAKVVGSDVNWRNAAFLAVERDDDRYVNSRVLPEIFE